MVAALILFLAAAWLFGRLRRAGLGGWLACGAAFMILFGGGQPQHADVTAALVVAGLVPIGVRWLGSALSSGERKLSL